MMNGTTHKGVVDVHGTSGAQHPLLQPEGSTRVVWLLLEWRLLACPLSPQVHPQRWALRAYEAPACGWRTQDHHPHMATADSKCMPCILGADQAHPLLPKRPLRDTPSPSASLLVVTSAPPHSQTDPQPSPAAGPTMSARHGHHRPPPGAAVVCIHTSFPHRAASASHAQHFTPSVLAPLLPCTHKAWCLPAGGAPLQAAQVDQQPASTQRWFQPQQQLTHQVSSN
jgi:hypothetical protein